MVSRHETRLAPKAAEAYSPPSAPQMQPMASVTSRKPEPETVVERTLPTPAAEPTFQPALLTPPRTGVGPHANFLERLDPAFRLFEQNVGQLAITPLSDASKHDVDLFDYFHQLLLYVSDHGASQYTTPMGDTVQLGNFEEWLDSFCTAILDPFSVRCSELLLAGLDGDDQAQQLGDVYLDLLQYQIPEALRVSGYEPVPAFPLIGTAPQSATMRVLGTTNRPAFVGRVVGVRQYGLLKGRKVVRPALVTTG